ncbi:MAG: plasmid pRiA4b ORF-3 family protein, partial [Bacteroidota bacterium]|nr:plasmid pRiA4b ORF-3 family protein [Bacteroidota bacterium]
MTYQFKIQIKNITKPPVWWRLMVPETFSFHKLHELIQISFGWENCHLYMFNSQGYGSKPVIA